MGRRRTGRPSIPQPNLRSNVAALWLAREGPIRLQLDTLVAQEEGLGAVSAYTAIIRAVAGGATTRSRIADATGLKLDHALVRRLDTLVALDPLEDAPVVEAPRNAPARYRLPDPALRFHHYFVSPQASLIERSEPLEVYDAVVQPRLDTFLGPAFERLLAPTYDRIRRSRDLPLVQEWGRWEGRDRGRRSVEVDVVARLAAGGFDARFLAAAEAHATRVIAWMLEDVYAEG